MEYSEQQHRDNVAANRWTKKYLLPIIQDDCLLALKHLQQHTRRKPIGNPESFAHNTMQWCEFAAAAIARSLIVDASASLEIRASAMALLVSHKNLYPRSIDDLDVNALLLLLQEDATDNFARLEMVRLVRNIALSEELWQATDTSVKTVLRKIGRFLNIKPLGTFTRPSALIKTSDEYMRRLIHLSSHPETG